MDELDQKPSFSGGGGARSGGSLYHLSFRSGSRAGGASARSAYDYVTRQDEYGDPDRDPVIYTESEHMPSWAEDDPEYWEVADLYERANGRLYVSADFALPQGLSAEDQIALACEFAHELTDEEHLPYTLAIHAGLDENGEEHNPHAHLMFSERQNDGIERSRDQWFKRANSEHPERGGAPKSRTFHGRAWVEQARERWGRLTNEKLARAGRSERVDHRSYQRQGIDRQPGEHYGPSAVHMAGRGDDHDRLESASSAVDDEEALRAVDIQIIQLEAERAAIVNHGLPDQPEPEARDYSHSYGGGRSDDQSRGR